MKLQRDTLDFQLKLPQLSKHQEFDAVSPQIVKRKQYRIIDQNHSQLLSYNFAQSSQDSKSSFSDEELLRDVKLKTLAGDKIRLHKQIKSQMKSRNFKSRISDFYEKQEQAKIQEKSEHLPTIRDDRTPLEIKKSQRQKEWGKDDFTTQQKFKRQAMNQQRIGIHMYFKKIKEKAKEKFQEKLNYRYQVNNSEFSNRQNQIDSCSSQEFLKSNSRRSFLSPQASSSKKSRITFLNSQVQKSVFSEELQLSLERRNNVLKKFSQDFEKSGLINLKNMNLGKMPPPKYHKKEIPNPIHCPEMLIQVNQSINEMDQIINERKEFQKLQLIRNSCNSEVLKQKQIQTGIQRKKNEIKIYIQNGNLQSELDANSPTLLMTNYSPVKVSQAQEFSIVDKLEKVPVKMENFLDNVMQDVADRKKKTIKMKKLKRQLTDLYQEQSKSHESLDQQQCEYIKDIDKALQIEVYDKPTNQQFSQIKTRFENRIPGLLRKHLMPKKPNIDIFYMNGVLNLEQKLLTIFDSEPGNFNSCLGNLYNS